MYSDEEYYENLGITEYDLDLAEEFERLFPPEPTDEELELYIITIIIHVHIQIYKCIIILVPNLIDVLII